MYKCLRSEDGLSVYEQCARALCHYASAKIGISATDVTVRLSRLRCVYRSTIMNPRGTGYVVQQRIITQPKAYNIII
jgi:hypothetical protein